MDILPAIDLRGGQVVRLAQGDYDRQTTYGSDPAAVAREFVAAGATWIHMVDLDSARLTQLDAAQHAASANAQAVASVHQAVGARIELGGGARDEAAIRRMMQWGVSRVVVGSAALKDWAWFEGLLADRDLAPRLALDLAAKAGQLTVHGWTQTTELQALDLARRVKGSRLGAIVYTDVLRDGLLVGPNFEATAELVAATDVQIIASGGVGSLDDLRRCRQIGCGGAIVGRAYYEGRIDLAEAFAILNDTRYTN